MYGKDRDGVARPLLMKDSGQLMGMGDLSDAAINGRLFHTCTQAATTTTATGVEAHTGLLVGNPTGSGKYFIMHEFGFASQGEIADEGHIGLVTGAIGNMALVAAPVIYSSLVGSGASSVGYADSAGVTAGTLSVVKIIGQLNDATVATGYGSDIQVVDLQGSIVLAPGYLIGTDTTVIAGAVMWFHFLWEEIDV